MSLVEHFLVGSHSAEEVVSRKNLVQKLPGSLELDELGAWYDPDDTFHSISLQLFGPHDSCVVLDEVVLFL